MPPLPSLLCALGALAVSSGVVLGLSDAAGGAPVAKGAAYPVVGNERPLFLGSMTVTATALPPR